MLCPEPEGHDKTLADACADAQRLGALGAVKHEKTNAIGLRIIRDSPQAKQVAVAIRGTDASLAKGRYRIAGIESKCATLTQIGSALHTMKWECEVYHAAWDPATASNFALVKAHGPRCWPKKWPRNGSPSRAKGVPYFNATTVRLAPCPEPPRRPWGPKLPTRAQGGRRGLSRSHLGGLLGPPWRPWGLARPSWRVGGRGLSL